MTINIELNDLVNLQNENTAVTQINQNSESIEGGFSTALNVTGDKMQGNLDLNSFQIINLPAPATANSPLRLIDASMLISGGSITTITLAAGTGINISGSTISVSLTGTTGIAVSGATISLASTASATAGTNIVITGTSPAITISTVTSPSFNSVNATNISVSGIGGFTNLSANNFTSVNAASFGSFSASTVVGTIGTFIIGNITTANITTANVTTANVGTANITSITTTSPLILPFYTVTALNAVSTPATGMVAMVTDSATTLLGSTLTGGGTAKILVLYTGSAWIEA